MKIQKLSSSKLFYNKWPYKLECRVIGANRISYNGMALAKEFCLGNVQGKRTYRTRALDKDEKDNLLKFINAIEPFLELKDQLQTRADSCTYNIFCKDIVLLETIHSALKPWVRQVVGPTTDEELDFMLDNGHKKILRDVLPYREYQYKIYFKHLWPADERLSFFKWTQNYPDNIIVNYSSKRWLMGGSNWAYNPFMYVKDAKTMTMVGLKISGYVRQVDEFVLRDGINTCLDQEQTCQH